MAVRRKARGEQSDWQPVCRAHPVGDQGWREGRRPRPPPFGEVVVLQFLWRLLGVPEQDHLGGTRSAQFKPAQNSQSNKQHFIAKPAGKAVIAFLQ